MDLNKIIPNSKSSNFQYQKRLANLFFVLALFFGVILIFLEPPYVCPDENAHLTNIFRISHGGIFADISDDNQIGSYVSADEYDYYHSQCAKYNSDTDKKFSLTVAQQLNNTVPSDEMKFISESTATANPFSYVVPVLVIVFFRLLGFTINAYNAMLLAKIANLLLYAIIIRLAISKTGILPKTMFMLSLMPMTIFQGASTSYDVLVISGAFLMFAYTTKILLSDETYLISSQDIVAICISSAFLVACKPAYVTLLLLLFAIPIKKFESLKKYLICIGMVIITVFVTYVIPTLITSGIINGYEAPLTEAEILQKEYFNSHWYEMPLIILRTLKNHLVDYSESFFGVLGWLDTRFPSVFYYIFMVLLSICAISEMLDTKGIRIKTRILAYMGSLIMFVGTMTIMFIEFNPILFKDLHTTEIYGIQGRYFIPIIPFLCLTLCFPLISKLRISSNIRTYTEKAVPAVSSLYLVLTVFLLLIRYWA